MNDFLCFSFSRVRSAVSPPLAHTKQHIKVRMVDIALPFRRSKQTHSHVPMPDRITRRKRNTHKSHKCKIYHRWHGRTMSTVFTLFGVMSDHWSPKVIASFTVHCAQTSLTYSNGCTAPINCNRTVLARIVTKCHAPSTESTANKSVGISVCTRHNSKMIFDSLHKLNASTDWSGVILGERMTKCEVRCRQCASIEPLPPQCTYGCTRQMDERVKKTTRATTAKRTTSGQN